jgi:hypothetical protein
MVTVLHGAQYREMYAGDIGRERRIKGKRACERWDKKGQARDPAQNVCHGFAGDISPSQKRLIRQSR